MKRATTASRVSVLKRPDGDEVAQKYGTKSYFNTKKLRTTREGDRFEVLCEDELHYIVIVKRFDSSSLRGHLHFDRWNQQHDYHGPLDHLYLAAEGTHTKGIISSMNYYPAEPNSATDNEDTKSGKKSQPSLSNTRYDDDFLARPYRPSSRGSGSRRRGGTLENVNNLSTDDAIGRTEVSLGAFDPPASTSPALTAVLAKASCNNTESHNNGKDALTNDRGSDSGIRSDGRSAIVRASKEDNLTMQSNSLASISAVAGPVCAAVSASTPNSAEDGKKKSSMTKKASRGNSVLYEWAVVKLQQLQSENNSIPPPLHFMFPDDFRFNSRDSMERRTAKEQRLRGQWDQAVRLLYGDEVADSVQAADSAIDGKSGIATVCMVATNAAAAGGEGHIDLKAPKSEAETPLAQKCNNNRTGSASKRKSLSKDNASSSPSPPPPSPPSPPSKRAKLSPKVGSKEGSGGVVRELATAADPSMGNGGASNGLHTNRSDKRDNTASSSSTGSFNRNGSHNSSTDITLDSEPMALAGGGYSATSPAPTIRDKSIPKHALIEIVSASSFGPRSAAVGAAESGGAETFPPPSQAAATRPLPAGTARAGALDTSTIAAMESSSNTVHVDEEYNEASTACEGSKGRQASLTVFTEGAEGGASSKWSPPPHSGSMILKEGNKIKIATAPNTNVEGSSSHHFKGSTSAGASEGAWAGSESASLQQDSSSTKMDIASQGLVSAPVLSAGAVAGVEITRAAAAGIAAATSSGAPTLPPSAPPVVAQTPVGATAGPSWRAPSSASTIPAPTSVANVPGMMETPEGRITKRLNIEKILRNINLCIEDTQQAPDVFVQRKVPPRYLAQLLAAMKALAEAVQIATQPLRNVPRLVPASSVAATILSRVTITSNSSPSAGPTPNPVLIPAVAPIVRTEPASAPQQSSLLIRLPLEANSLEAASSIGSRPATHSRAIGQPAPSSQAASAAAMAAVGTDDIIAGVLKSLDASNSNTFTVHTNGFSAGSDRGDGGHQIGAQDSSLQIVDEDNCRGAELEDGVNRMDTTVTGTNDLDQ